MMWVSLQFSGGAGPSMQKRNGFKEFFFNGNQTHSEIVTTLKQNLLTIAKGPKVPPIYCLHEACTPQKVQVYLIFPSKHKDCHLTLLFRTGIKRYK